MCLTSCNTSFHYIDHLQDYVINLKYHDAYNILQLTDIHWNITTSTISSKAYLEQLFLEVDKHIKDNQGSDAHIDLVELTGDLFMLANTFHVDTFIDFFEQQASKYNFKYATIWGNHDHHGLYNPNWLSKRFMEAPHSLHIEAADDLYGRSNFIINLSDDEKTRWQIANFDSGTSFSETSISLNRDYDYIRDDQVDWWLKEHALVGDSVPAIAYYHIPQDDNAKAYNAIRNEGASYKNKYFKLEDFANNGKERYDSKLIKEGRSHHLKAAFMGHAHNNDWVVEYDGVVIGLGVKTGRELYYAHIKTDTDNAEMNLGLSSVGINENFDLIGASLVTLNSGEQFDLEHLYYNNRIDEDFVRWVKW